MQMPCFQPSLSALRRASWLLTVIGAVIVCSGCDSLITGPEPEPTPTPVKAPKPDVFDAADGITSDPTKVIKLNDNNPADPKLPDSFRVARIDSAELLWVQSVKKIGTPPNEHTELGVPDLVRLAGIITPAPGQLGFAEAVARVNRWTLGQDIDIEQDIRFPVDLNSRRMVQIFFKGREGNTKDTRMLLNRMLVRLGYAVVDVHSPTSIDVKPWLNDEQFARNHRLGLWRIPGVLFGQRPVLPLPGAKNRRQNVQLQNNTQQSSTKIKTEAQAPANAAAPPSPANGAPADPAAPSDPATSSGPAAPPADAAAPQAAP